MRRTIASLTATIALLAVLVGSVALARPNEAKAADPSWVNSLTYGSIGGGFYWDFTSGQTWTQERGWHLYSPIQPGPSTLWVNYLTYGSAGGGFYLDPFSGQVWTAERGWHLFSPGGAPNPPTPPPPPSPVAGLGTTRNSPYPMGTPGKVGDWQMVVNSVTPNANAAIAARNQFNKPPAAGHQFFIANVSLTYQGTKSKDHAGILDFHTVGAANVSYVDYSDHCGVTPDELEKYKDVFPGGTVTGNLCWSVTTGDVGSLELYSSRSSGLDIWFALKR